MKKYIFVIITLFAIPSILAQNNESRIFSYIGVSSTNFPGSFSDYWSNGVNFGLGLDLSINERVSFMSYVEFSSLPFNENNVKENLGVNVSRIDRKFLYMFNISGNIKYKIYTSKIITPYLIAGLGYFIWGTDGTTRVKGFVMSSDGNKVENTIIGFNVSKYAFSSNFGAGFDVDFNSKFGMFLDVRYFIGFTEDLSTSVPFRMGVTYKL